MTIHAQDDRGGQEVESLREGVALVRDRLTELPILDGSAKRSLALLDIVDALLDTTVKTAGGEGQQDLDLPLLTFVPAEFMELAAVVRSAAGKRDTNPQRLVRILNDRLTRILKQVTRPNTIALTRYDKQTSEVVTDSLTDLSIRLQLLGDDAGTYASDWSTDTDRSVRSIRQHNEQVESLKANLQSLLTRLDTPDAQADYERLSRVADILTALLDTSVNIALETTDDQLVGKPNEPERLHLVAFLLDEDFSALAGTLQATSASADTGPAVTNAVTMRLSKVLRRGLYSTALDNRALQRALGDSAAPVRDPLAVLSTRIEILANLFEIEEQNKDARKQLDGVRQVADQVGAIEGDVREAAGEVADAALSEHFESFARTESKRASLWTASVFVWTLAAGGVAVWLLLLRADPTELDVADVLAHAALALPLLALAGYSASEARQHRSSAGWARSLAVQLRTLKAFTDALPTESRSEVRRDFAQVVFGRMTHDGSGASPDVSAASLRMITDLVRPLKSNP